MLLLTAGWVLLECAAYWSWMIWEWAGYDHVAQRTHHAIVWPIAAWMCWGIASRYIGDWKIPVRALCLTAPFFVWSFVSIFWISDYKPVFAWQMINLSVALSFALAATHTAERFAMTRAVLWFGCCFSFVSIMSEWLCPNSSLQDALCGDTPIRTLQILTWAILLSFLLVALVANSRWWRRL